MKIEIPKMTREEIRMNKKVAALTTLAGILTIAGILLGGSSNAPAQVANVAKPTIVLVHGAFAESSSWNGVAAILEHDGYPVLAAANPLRGVHSDAAYLSDLLTSIKTPVLLVGHSYGGLVISEAANRKTNVKGLVFVSAFAPDSGETALSLSSKFPGSTLGQALAAPVALSRGEKDLYIRRDKFHEQFAADVSSNDALSMFVTQRPVTESALNEPSVEPAWKRLPSWFVYGDQDRNIPRQALAFMATRAGSKRTVVVRGASHVVMVSNPEAVARLIESAAGH